ncbi:MAG: hypothetical protein ABSG93_15230 [Solirubrobacteraceae bacterium]|jgi:hypothetical protein
MSARALLEADDHYEVHAPALQENLLRRLQQFHGSESRDALQIQEAASAIASELRRFSSVRASMMSQIAILRVSLNQAATLAGLSMLESIVHPITTGEAGLAGLRSTLEGLDEADRRNAYLVAEAAHVAGETAKASLVAAAVIKERQAKLEQYCDALPAAERAGVLRAALDAFAAEGTVTLAAHALTITVLLVAGPVGVPAAVVTETLIAITNSVRGTGEKLKASETPYSRGGVTAVFELKDQLAAENEGVAALSTHFGVLFDAHQRLGSGSEPSAG